MARKRKNKSGFIKTPGATNWKKLSEKLNSEKIVKKCSKKVSNINLNPNNVKLIDSNDANVSFVQTLAEKCSRKSKPLIIGQNNTISTNITHRLALDCEMVGSGKDGLDNQLARVSIVNVYGDVLYDRIVLPREVVTDYRSAITGLNKEIITTQGIPFTVVQKEVADIVKGKVIIGHDIQHDFKVLEFSHPKPFIRDTAKYKPFKALSKGNTPSLKKLCKEILKTSIQEGAHDSVKDAQNALQLYRMHRASWERSIKRHKKKAQKRETVDDHDQSSSDDALND